MADKKKRNKIKIGSFVTETGTAKYPHLNSPDTKWKEEGEYRCPLIFSEEVADRLRPKLEAFLEKGFNELKKALVLPVCNQTPSRRHRFHEPSRTSCLMKRGQRYGSWKRATASRSVVHALPSQHSRHGCRCVCRRLTRSSGSYRRLRAHWVRLASC